MQITVHATGFDLTPHTRSFVESRLVSALEDSAGTSSCGDSIGPPQGLALKSNERSCGRRSPAVVGDRQRALELVLDEGRLSQH